MCEGCGRSFDTDYLASACMESEHSIGRTAYFSTDHSWRYHAQQAGWRAPSVPLTDESNEMFGDRLDERLDAMRSHDPDAFAELEQRVAALEFLLNA